MARTVRSALVMALMTLAPVSANAAEAYPSRPIQVIVPLTAGSVLDLLARALTEAMAKTSPQTFLVLNREGASGVIGTTLVARAKPDGYTLGYGGDSTFTVSPHVTANLPYGLDSFDLVCQTTVSPMVVVVGPGSKFQTLADLVEAARKANPPLSYATVGNASMMHLVGETFAAEAGLKLSMVPFRSVADMNTQTINGNVDFTITLPNILTLGRGLRGLALTLDEPMAALPTIPLMGALGYKRSVMYSAHGLFAPRGLPAEVLGWLRKACADAVRTESFQTMTQRTHTVARHRDGEPYDAAMRRALVERGEIIRTLGLKPE